MRPIATSLGVRDFLDGPHTVDAAQDVFSSGLGTAAGLIGLFGSLFLGLAFVLVALNAMRAGLLTRFMGILGIIVGVLVVIPLGSPLPIVQCFWLFAFSLLLLGRLPTGVPRAWETGQAHAWPSSSEVRAERRRAMEERRRGAGATRRPRRRLHRGGDRRRRRRRGRDGPPVVQEAQAQAPQLIALTAPARSTPPPPSSRPPRRSASG